ncbi:hypothetical protein AVEN_85387-1 [Araneus ventricosus]|uniref:Uncharacterized protein n=1 Tax=Araneus ventricosus TaxID=182803 RepID=A0A4Y2M2Y2_ARAVE|nr:hypothetical protein AVEN_3282-1 [Araneus ventricosus]GBN33943.1 hypothetical protein AVEN_85387-1 [Araneus ventricosus]
MESWDWDLFGSAYWPSFHGGALIGACDADEILDPYITEVPNLWYAYRTRSMRTPVVTRRTIWEHAKSKLLMAETRKHMGLKS